MKLYEYQAKNIFNENGIRVPNGRICLTEKEVEDAFSNVGKGREVILKAQVLVGGRGKSGGIKMAKSKEETFRLFRELIGFSIKGFPVTKVLIEEKIEIQHEYYVSITIDPTFSKPILLISSKGGMEIETIIQELPSAIFQYIIDPRYGIPSYQVVNAINKLGISKELSFQLIDIVQKLYKIFRSYDATLIEINPLVVSEDGEMIAVDARLNIDDNALYKHSEFDYLREEYGENENQEAFLKSKGIDFVYIGGNVGLICAGAGLTLATMDLISAYGGRPACFCDVTAGINPQTIELAIKIVSRLNGVKSILVNMFGGVTRMDEVAHSFIEAWKNLGGFPLPVVFRIEGTNVEQGRKMMELHGFIMFTNTRDAVQRAVELAT